MPTPPWNRPAAGGGWVRSVALDTSDVEDLAHHPFDIPAIRGMGELPLHPAVTFLVGANGSGKSTLVEAIAVALGFNAEGGSRNMTFSTRDSTSALHQHLRIIRAPRRPSTGYFLRAESFFNVATDVDGNADALEAHGGRSLHERSHGESFLTLVTHRFGPRGLYVLDEPEAALSPDGCLALLRRIHDLVGERCQLVVATHSPLLIAYPDAVVYELGPDGIAQVPYTETATYRLHADFVHAPDRFLHHLLAD